MQTLVVYDIPGDRVRGKIADICLDYGLERIQYSVFLGGLSDNRREELIMKLKKRLGKEEGGIQIFVICEKDLRTRLQLGTPPQDKHPEREKCAPEAATPSEASDAETRPSLREHGDALPLPAPDVNPFADPPTLPTLSGRPEPVARRRHGGKRARAPQGDSHD